MEPAAAAAAAAAVPEVRERAAQVKMEASGVASFLMETGRLLAPSRASSFISLVFYLSVPVFLFLLTYFHLSRRQLQK